MFHKFHRPQRAQITRIRKFFRSIASIVVAAVFLTVNVAAAQPAPTPPVTPPTAPPSAVPTPEEAAKITAESLYGNWHQYVPGDQPLGGACGAGGGFTPADINVDKGFSLGTDGKERRVNLVKALMRDYQLSGEQGSGIVGNFMYESGGEHVPPDVNEGGKPGPPAFKGGYGWAQWTGPRQRGFIDFAVKNGYMASPAVNATDAADYAWLKNELNTGYKSTIVQLKTKSTPEDAAISFEATFERAGVPALAKRTAAARKVFNELNGGGGGSGSPATGGTGAPCAGGGGLGIVGDTAFPLKTTKSGITNRGMFKNGTSDRGGHPYIAFDILTAPNTEVVAFSAGTVTYVGQDRCPGTMVSIHNPTANVTVSYLHMEPTNHVVVGNTVTPGQHVGVVGAAARGCGTPHLHIDAAQGNTRPGCSRLNCPPANQAKFIDIGPQLFTTFQALPD